MIIPTYQQFKEAFKVDSGKNVFPKWILAICYFFTAIFICFVLMIAIVLVEIAIFRSYVRGCIKDFKRGIQKIMENEFPLTEKEKTMLLIASFCFIVPTIILISRLGKEKKKIGTQSGTAQKQVPKQGEETLRAVYTFKTKYKEGFINSELQDLLRLYPSADKDSFYKALDNTTCSIIDGQQITYFCDVQIALYRASQKEEILIESWD